MAKATGLIFLLLDVASAQQVPFILQCVQCMYHDLPLSSFVSHFFLLTVQGVNL